MKGTNQAASSPVDGDACDGEGGDEGDADGDHAAQLADDLRVGAGPPLEEDLHQRHGRDHRAEQEVAHRQVDDQYVVDLKRTSENEGIFDPLSFLPFDIGWMCTATPSSLPSLLHAEEFA